MTVPDDVRRMGEVEHIIDPKPSMPVDFGRAPVSTLSSMTELSQQSDRALFQYSEFLLEHGLIDLIVPRLEMRERVINLLKLLYRVPQK